MISSIPSLQLGEYRYRPPRLNHGCVDWIGLEADPHPRQVRGGADGVDPVGQVAEAVVPVTQHLQSSVGLRGTGELLSQLAIDGGVSLREIGEQEGAFQYLKCRDPRSQIAGREVASGQFAAFNHVE